MYTTGAPEELLVEKRVGVTSFVLNRPKALNALNLNQIKMFTPELKHAEEDSNVKMVMLSGAGEKAFCAGGDIKALYNGKEDRASQMDFFAEEYRLDHLTHTISKPYIALIDGITMGGGVGLSVHGRYRVATERSVFAMPETAIGFFPDVGGSYFLPRLKNNLGMYFALTGARIKGEDLVHAGIATHFVPSERMQSLKDRLYSVAPAAPAGDGAFELVENVLKEHAEAPSTENSVFLPHLQQIKETFGAQSVNEIFAALEKSDTEFAKKTLATLQKMSPLSLKVTFAGIRKGGFLKTLADCLAMEYRIAFHTMESHDFYEGVHSVLINKDKTAEWNPSSVEKVEDEQVMKYFKPCEGFDDLDLTIVDSEQ